MSDLPYLILEAACLILVITMGSYLLSFLLLKNLREMGFEINKTLEGKIRCLTHYVLVVFIGVVFSLYYLLLLLPKQSP